jgi:hypothetical protein
MKKNVMAWEMSEAIVHIAERTLTRLDGMTDAEYLWEPVEGCWNVREHDGAWRVDLGPGGTQWTDAPPVTTIAWRLWHLGASPNPDWPPRAATAREFADTWFTPKATSPNAIGNAAAAVAAFAAHWRAFAADVASYPDAELMERIGPVSPEYGDSTIYGLVFHVVDELIHHSAEIGVLRDLYPSAVRCSGDAASMR